MMQSIAFIILLCCNGIHFLSKKVEEYRQETYYFFISTSRFIASPIRCLTAPYFQINISTDDYVQQFARIRQLKQEIKDNSLIKPLSEEHGFQLIRETTSKGLQIEELYASINVPNIVYAQQHDQLTFLEKVFTDRKEELDNHLRIVAQEYKLLSDYSSCRLLN